MKLLSFIIIWLNRILLGVMFMYHLIGLITEEVDNFIYGFICQFFVGVLHLLILLIFPTALKDTQPKSTILYRRLLNGFFLLVFILIVLEYSLSFRYDFIKDVFTKVTLFFCPLCLAMYFTYLVESVYNKLKKC